MELKQANLREKKLIEDLSHLKSAANHTRETRLEELSKLQSDTEETLKRKQQLITLLERQIKELTSEIKAKDIHAAELKKDLLR